VTTITRHLAEEKELSRSLAASDDYNEVSCRKKSRCFKRNSGFLQQPIIDYFFKLSGIAGGFDVHTSLPALSFTNNSTRLLNLRPESSAVLLAIGLALLEATV
jgi:hypothetical protein